MYPICQTSDKSGHPNLQTNGICQTSDKLTWSHICELVTIDDQLEREFYEKECISEGWTINELHRQKESGLFMRLAVSKDIGYFAKEENVEGDNPPVGILLCTRKGKKMVEYAIAGMDNNLFVPTCYSCLIRLRSRSSYWTKLETVLSRFWEMNINI